MKYTSFLLQATGLLLTIDGYIAGAESVDGANPENTTRELIGFRNWFKINPSPTLAPMPPPPGVNGYYLPPAPGGQVPGTPTKFPTKPPTPFPTRGEPSSSPTSPTAAPTMEPSSEPSEAPTKAPTEAPSASPTVAPTVAPTPKPTKPKKTKRPTKQPTTSPSTEPTMSVEPTETPTSLPSFSPSFGPTRKPTSSSPTREPTLATTTLAPISGRSYFDLDLKKAVEEPDSMTIFEIVCDEDNAYLWGTLCTVLKEAEIFGFLDSNDNQYALFAPTNEAFENSDYSIELLLQNKAAIQSLMATHITQNVLPYDELTCDLSLEMLNYYYTNTLCIGSRKIQNADGNELRNLPIIDESADFLAKNGMIHPVSNLIIPFEFSVHTQLVDGSTGNSIDTDIVDTILHLVGNLTTNQNEGNVTSTESDVDDSITPSVVVVEKDSTQSDFDGQSTIIADTSDQPTVGEAQVTLGDVIQSLSNVAADRDSIISDTSENTCQVCASRDECKHPRKATFLFPGEGPVLCADVLDRQNSPEGIVLEQAMCSALQQRFNEYCLSAGN